MATCQVLQAQGAEVILEYAGVTTLVATRVNQATPLRSEIIGVYCVGKAINRGYLSNGKLQDGQLPVLGGGGKWLIDRLSKQNKNFSL